MKKLFLVLVWCLITGVASAQDIEVVYLRNGSVIRGCITEQVPNQYLKVQTVDGSCIICPFDEVEKITKETTVKNSVKNKSFGQSDDGFGGSTAFRPRYEGLFDFGYSIDIRDQDTGRICLSTTQGCLVLPYLYVGGGVGFDYYHAAKVCGVPLFANLRGYFVKNREVRQFFNVRAGYSVGDIKGLHLSPSVGLTYRHLEFGVGYTYQGVKVYFWGDEYILHTGAVTIKAGLRF